jgi:saccharopine dehydrogenase-like NADP-dependent oxidoreductase
LSSFAAPKTTILLSKFKKLGLFSDEAAEPRGNLLDTLCAHLEKLMQYENGEQDLVYLQHTFIVERADGKTETITSVLDEQGAPSGYSAMARLVGVPCGIAVDLVLNGTIKTPGVLAPYDIEVC